MMTHHKNLKPLRRPRLLVRAARLGLIEYNRDRDLKKLIKSNATPNPANAVAALMQQESWLEGCRKSGDGSYSIARHVAVLAALMSELRLLPQAGRMAS